MCDIFKLKEQSDDDSLEEDIEPEMVPLGAINHAMRKRLFKEEVNLYKILLLFL